MRHTCHAQNLRLNSNKIGDAGVTALANACAGGAMASLKELYIHGNSFGGEAKAQLTAACKARSITGMGF